MKSPQTVFGMEARADNSAPNEKGEPNAPVSGILPQPSKLFVRSMTGMDPVKPTIARRQTEDQKRRAAREVRWEGPYCY